MSEQDFISYIKLDFTINRVNNQGINKIRGTSQFEEFRNLKKKRMEILRSLGITNTSFKYDCKLPEY